MFPLARAKPKKSPTPSQKVSNPRPSIGSCWPELRVLLFGGLGFEFKAQGEGLSGLGIYIWDGGVGSK